MYDKDFSGQVSVDETMHMLFARYGKERLESEMKVGGVNGGHGHVTVVVAREHLLRRHVATRRPLSSAWLPSPPPPPS